MRGIEHLVELRRRRLAPSLVMVDLDAAPLAFVRMALPQPGEPAIGHLASLHQVPQLFIDPQENLSRLDLRALIGLRVFAFGHDGQRLDRFRDLALANEAAEVIRYDYTAGLMTWHPLPTHLTEKPDADAA